MTTLEHNYPLYIAIWFGLSLITLWLFRVIPRRMKEVKDPQTKSSLFTILIVTGIPPLLACVIVPAVFIIGDNGMEPIYRYGWSALVLIFVIYFFIKQKSRKEDSPDIREIKKNDYIQMK